ncbi:MAG: phosphoglycerate mutase (2,3-diphosphoglycerate-independent) [Piscirickettsiaceae bacterium]|nr:MAG: phosphoglycerate mutase (2,3-diphosphoglycerate-independent) [Piscirickettsiaceae bacterium]PCI66643.1 MAG: phosphoglycerate mutase (2,3-diphosphoglycerate-independent) [Piscirickettsiaceae bacterium]
MNGKLTPKPVVLMILDGFGYSESTQFNAIKAANTPIWDALWKKYPHALLDCSGSAVGLPDRQMGNSEVGHLHLGAGRLLAQTFTRLNNDVDSGEFKKNPVLSRMVEGVESKNAALHVVGLLSPGGVHSHENHIRAMLEMAAEKGVKKLYLHAILDGRDTPPRSAQASLEKMDETFSALGVGKTVSIIGRFYAMDRDNRWDRVQLAYDLMTAGKAQYSAPSATAGLLASYERDEGDEFVLPTSICADGEEPVFINNGDSVVFMNFRADRTRELTRALSEKGFSDFQREQQVNIAQFVCLTEYHEAFDLPVAYLPQSIRNSFGEVLAKQGLRQLRIAETEKYAHVTFFFNGGVDTPNEGEDRILIPSPDVKTYDLQPEMNAPELTDKLVEAILSKQYDAIITNFANCDMVGHTGNFEAAVKAVETIDVCILRVVEAIKAIGGEVFITADHGNAEQMSDPTTGQTHTAHTTNPVPFLYVGREASLLPSGDLADVSPTLLAAMGVDKPVEMTGHSLLVLDAE